MQVAGTIVARAAVAGAVARFGAGDWRLSRGSTIVLQGDRAVELVATTGDIVVATRVQVRVSVHSLRVSIGPTRSVGARDRRGLWEESSARPQLELLVLELVALALLQMKEAGQARLVATAAAGSKGTLAVVVGCSNCLHWSGQSS